MASKPSRTTKIDATLKNAVVLWRFDEAPAELRVPFNGGDEDFLILIPANFGELHALECLERLGNSNDIYRVNLDGTVDEREECRNWDHKIDEEITAWERTDWRCPNYPGCTIIVASHA